MKSHNAPSTATFSKAGTRKIFHWNSARTLVLLGALAAQIPILAQQDTTPPVLTGFTFTPMAVNTTTGPATVTVTAQVTDDLSGVMRVIPTFISPSQKQIIMPPSLSLALTSGTDLNGTWTGTVSFPAFSE